VFEGIVFVGVSGCTPFLNLFSLSHFLAQGVALHLVAHLRGGKQQIFAQTLTAMKRAPSWARWEPEPKGRKGSGSKGQGGRDKGSFGSSKGGSYDGKGPFGREGKSGGGSDAERSAALAGEALAAVARAAAAADFGCPGTLSLHIRLVSDSGPSSIECASLPGFSSVSAQFVYEKKGQRQEGCFEHSLLL
jgi:hypothetical protein